MALMRPEQRFALPKLSSQSRLNLLCLLLTLIGLIVQLSLTGPATALSLAICGAGIVLAILLQWAMNPLTTEIKALNLHAQNLQDGSFNTSANQLTVHELQGLAQSLTNMSAQLRSERATLYQRELLLGYSDTQRYVQDTAYLGAVVGPWGAFQRGRT